jgi:predicted O-methyltransferase YrrM
MPITNAVLNMVGIYPLKDNYYEPLINRKTLDKSYGDSRELPGIDWNESEQLEYLEKFQFKEELARFPVKRTKKREYFYSNGFFGAGDAGYLYSIIRIEKPKKIIEIGSGYSTLMALEATRKNLSESKDSTCELICIEPYRQKRLTDLPVTVIGEPVENLDLTFFQQLEKGDILFIDSSHMIRPQGDVLFEILHILPTLKSGVLVHVHDIFSPFDYPNEWIIDGYSFWNEQYLLEAFLSFNTTYRIVGAINFLSKRHHDLVKNKIPLLEDGCSCWLKKI